MSYNPSTTATVADGSITIAKLGGDITAVGTALLDDATVAAQRTTLGLGTAATTAATAYATAIHAHAIGDTTGLQVALDAKAAGTHAHVIADTTGLQAAIDAKAAAAHTHLTSEVTGLDAALTGKAATTHAHAAADVTSGTLASARLGSGTASATTFLRGDASWAVPAVSATTVEATLALGWEGRFTITNAAITATSKVLCWQAAGPYTGKGTRADEAAMQPVLIIAVVSATGSAVVYWQTPPMGGRQRIGRVRGNVKFSYLVLS